MNINSLLDDADEDTLDMTSLIDVVFLLLTFFILAATFVSPSLDVNLPEAQSAATAQGLEHALIFSVDSQGELYYQKEVINKEAYKGLLTSHTPETPLVFNVDQNAPFQAFLSLLDEARVLDRHRFLINAQHPTDSEGPEPESGSGPSPIGGDSQTPVSVDHRSSGGGDPREHSGAGPDGRSHGRGAGDGRSHGGGAGDGRSHGGRNGGHDGEPNRRSGQITNAPSQSRP